MKNLKTAFLLLFAVSLFTFTSCKDDDPVTPDYSTYSFENFLLTDDVELESSNGYSFTVKLNRSVSDQEDDITVELTDPSGKFGFSDGTASMDLTFAENESSKTITVQPVSTSDVSLFETYTLTVDMVPPAGTDVLAEFSKSVNASVAVNWVNAGDGTIDYGWSVAEPVYGSASKTVSLEKDSNVSLYKAKDLYASGYDIEFAIVDGEVVIDTDQRMFETDPALLGALYIMIMEGPTAVYDATAKTVTITYDMSNEDPAGVNLPNNLRLGIVDVITLP